MSAKIIVTDNYTWTNEHNNISQQILHRYQVFNTPGTGWRDGLAGVQEMLGRARAASERVRSYGGKWSLSDVAVCRDTMHDTKPLTFWGGVGQNSVVGTPLFDDPQPLKNRLFYFQSGAQITQINTALEARGYCLPTTGASNGQTIAGAVSTGTHGSALRIGAMQDYVRALHIVTDQQKHVIIQPASRPVVNTTFSDVFGAELLTDDELFYSAVVSFGCFGVIIGVLVETLSLYMLETYSLRVDYTRAAGVFQCLSGFDPACAPTTSLSDFLRQFGLPSQEDPHHIDVIVNPYAATSNAFLRVMYKRPYDRSKLSPEPGVSGHRVGNDILSFIGSIADVASGLVPAIVTELFGQAAEVQSGYTQTPRNIFGDSTLYKPKNGGASTELGVPIERAANAVALVMNTAVQANFAGLIGVRFVRNSAATLAFTRFAPLTCTIELPGLNSTGTQHFYRQVYSGMDNAGIPFTLHWGQEGDYSPARLAAMYGAAVHTWVQARNRLLADPVQRYMFTNDFLKRLGLGEAAPLTGGGVIV